MQECWINVYENNELGIFDRTGYAYNNFRNPIYRLHVKMKDKQGITIYYPLNWSRNKEYILLCGDIIQKTYESMRHLKP